MAGIIAVKMPEPGTVHSIDATVALPSDTHESTTTSPGAPVACTSTPAVVAATFEKRSLLTAIHLVAWHRGRCMGRVGGRGQVYVCVGGQWWA